MSPSAFERRLARLESRGESEHRKPSPYSDVPTENPLVMAMDSDPRRTLEEATNTAPCAFCLRDLGSRAQPEELNHSWVACPRRPPRKPGGASKLEFFGLL